MGSVGVYMGSVGVYMGSFGVYMGSFVVHMGSFGVYMGSFEYIWAFWSVCGISRVHKALSVGCRARGGGLGSRPIFKKFNEPYAPS